MAADFQEAAAGKRTNLRAAEALEQFDSPLRIGSTDGLGADEDQLCGVFRVTRGIGERNHAAEGGTQHDWVDDTERFTEHPNIITPLRQIPALPRSVAAAAIAAMVEIDNLDDIGQSRVSRSVDGMVGTGASMQHQQGRLFPHDRPVGHELAALDIEEQADPIHGHVHGPISFILMNGRPDQATCLFGSRH
jgi:hypothetical protein